MPDSEVLRLDAAERTYYTDANPVYALRATNTRVTRGELVGIVGRSGSGKSTLLNLLGLLDRPTAGRYLIESIDTGDLNEGELTALRSFYFGFVFQAYHLVPDLTASENAALPLTYRRLSAKGREQATALALERAGISHRAAAYPTTLSGGERQRVAIARAIAASPQVLLCDEPTGNLDRRTADQMIQLLKDLNAGGLTCLVVTHDVAIAEQMRRLLNVDDGRVEEA